MPRRVLPVSAALLLLGLPWLAPAQAQDGPPPATAPPAVPRTLAQALAQADASRDTVWLAVAAGKVTLPPDADPAPLPPGAPVSQIADAYGQIARTWETAGAVAPPTMTVLNTDPAAPDPYDGLPPADALKLLLGGLDDGQWQALTSGGLGYADLTSDSQQYLFRALFPGGTLVVQPLNGAMLMHRAHFIRLTGDDILGARLRLRQKVNLSLPVVGQPNNQVGGYAPDDGRPHYVPAWDQATPPSDTLYGVQLRATVPNAPKPSDLDTETLTTAVSVAGVRTVGGLVLRIGTAAHLELYADPRYENRAVTLIGPPSASAGDLLRALALCVCGTYRRVGPAYVLTDDVVGLGVRQGILARFAQAAEVGRAEDEADASDRLFARGGVDTLPTNEPGVGLTDAQRTQAMQNDPFWADSSFATRIPFAQLTPPQQGLARQEQRALSTSGGFQVILGGTVLFQSDPTLELLTPAVPGPVTLDASVGASQILQPSAKLRQKMFDQKFKEQVEKQQTEAAKNPAPVPAAPAPSRPTLASLLTPLPRRAVYAQPRTLKDVDVVIASMRRVGLNQLWLDVFSAGKSHLDGKEGNGKPDILTEALKRARGTGIAVIPALDLLDWGMDAPEGAADRTLLGETSAQVADFNRRYGQGLTGSDTGTPVPTTLCVRPDAPEVMGTLTALVRRLAATPGVPALALRGTVTSGYGHTPDDNSSGNDELGYTLPLRLACLRRAHLDPVELGGGLPEPMNMNTRAQVPDFVGDDWQALQQASKQWDALRAEADVSLMRALLAAAQQSAGRRFPFLVRQRGQSLFQDWWGLWDDPRALLPALTQPAIQGSFQADPARFAHSQCRVNVYALPAASAQSSWTLALLLGQMEPGWDGFLIDTTPLPGVVTVPAPDAADPLAALMRDAPGSP